MPIRTRDQERVLQLHAILSKFARQMADTSSADLEGHDPMLFTNQAIDAIFAAFRRTPRRKPVTP